MTANTVRKAGMKRLAVIVAALVLLLAIPRFASGYATYLLNLVGVFSLVAIGLNLLTGYSGQISLGHSAFFAIGAYATALLTQKAGFPFWLALPAAGVLTMSVGALIALPALRLKNLYLAIATLGFAIVTQKLIFEWRGLTGGGGGLEVPPPRLGAWALTRGDHMYYLIIAVLALGTWAASNLVRHRTGRAMIMLRESEVAAGCLGIGVARHKVIAFALSAFYTAIGGGLYCLLVRYINPESFSTGLSIMFLAMIVIGGLGTIPGSIVGATFYVLLPELFRGIKDAPGLIFGLSLVLVMVLMPQGLWGTLHRYLRRP